MIFPSKARQVSLFYQMLSVSVGYYHLRPLGEVCIRMSFDLKSIYKYKVSKIFEPILSPMLSEQRYEELKNLKYDEKHQMRLILDHLLS